MAGKQTTEAPERASRRQRNVPTINDVADHAGVSPMTVSRVINNAGAVRDDTRAKVEASIKALDYTPSAAARTLAGGDEMRIGLLYSNPSASYLSEFLMGSLDQARRSNVHLVVEKFEEDTCPDAIVKHLAQGRLGGIILPPPLCDAPEIIAALDAAGIPVVAVATGRMADELAVVRIDDRHAAAEMTQHLIALGHVRIAFIKGNPNQSASEQRFQGYLQALQGAGLKQDDDLIVQGFFSYRSGLDAAEQLLDMPLPPTAIFASNDDMAAAAVAVAHRRGLDVPGDLTVCGFDDTPLATTIWPELTTIRQPIADMSRAAVDLLVGQLRGRKAGKAAGASHVLLDYTLVRRQSDAAPRRRPRSRTERPA